MAEKKKESSTQRRARLSKERTARRQALKAKSAKNTKTVLSGVADMLFGKKNKPAAKGKGGAIVKSKGSAIVKSKGGALAKTSKPGKPKVTGGKLDTKAKGPRGMRTRLPPGTKGGALAKVSKLGRLGDAIAVGAALGTAYKNTDRVKAESGRGAGRKTFNEKTKAKPKAKAKPSSAETRTPIKNRRGRTTGYVAPAKRGMSNIPPDKKPAVKSPVSPKKVSKGVSTPKAKAKAPVAPSRRPSTAPKPKTTSGKNPYRVPQGAERKDRMSKVVAELKAMRERSRKRQGK